MINLDLLLIFCLCRSIYSKNFEVLIEEPSILTKHYPKGLDYVQIAQGQNKENYSEFITLKTFNDKNSGCKKYNEDFSKDSQNLKGVLLADSENCPLLTKIHYAQEANARVLFLKYIDDNIQEARVEEQSFFGVDIPVLMLKASDAQKITDVLESTETMNSFKIQFTHSDAFDRKKNLIQIFMSSQPLNNPMIHFLKDLKEHQSLLQQYEISIRFSIGYCKSCQDDRFMHPEPNCLSGGRYCIINSNFHSSQPVLETLRQICIRRLYGSFMLIEYLINLQQLVYQDTKKFNEENYTQYSLQAIKLNQLDYQSIERCMEKSFVSRKKGQKPNKDLDQNTLLKEEQAEYFKITKYNIFPLIIVNSVFYDKSINIRDFIKFGCNNFLFDCRGFNTFKKYFLLSMFIICLFSVLVIAVYCRNTMKRKMEMELDLKVNQAVEKYLVTHPNPNEN